jgi:BirA family biotin operon repressor/biotin-[acetyl-CoA-carboxylase] ligase
MKTHLHLQCASSTNTCLKELVEKYPIELLPKFYPPFFSLTADQQENGHGRQGKKWESDTGKNLLLSVLLYPRILPSNQFYVCQYVSTGILLLLKDWFGIHNVRIKWPNDIYAGDKKIAGILIEHFIQGETINYSIAGIGLNVNQKIFPDTLPNPTSLCLETGREYDIDLCRKRLVRKIRTMSRIHPEYLCYERYLYRLGEFVDYILPAHSDSPMSLKIIGVNDKGLLQLVDKNNTEYSCAFNEIIYCPKIF